MRSLFLVAALLAVPPGPLPGLWAQGSAPPPSGRYARIVVIQPRPGQDSAFEAGYRRHLTWHRTHRDPWTWHGWSFVLGERLNAFMDGTFGHDLADFDTPVEPAGDGADNRVNVSPYAEFLSHGVYERLDRFSLGAPLPDDTPFLALTTYRLEPGQAATFEGLLAAAHPTAAPAPRFAWYRLVRGGSAPTYLLMQPAATFAAAASVAPILATWPAAGRQPLVREVRSEVLRYRPDMSYGPE